MGKNISDMDIDQVIKLTPHDLLDSESYGRIGQKVLDIERASLYSDAVKLSAFLQNFLDKNLPLEQRYTDLFSRYRKLILWLKGIALPFIENQDLETIFSSNLLALFNLDIDVREKLRILFKGWWDPFLRGEKRGILLRAMGRNMEKIGKYTMQVEQGRSVSSTVSSVIADYNRLSRPDEQRGNIEEMYYLSHSANIRQFSKEDREKVLKILQVYNFVRYPPVEEFAREMVVSPVTTGLQASGILSQRSEVFPKPPVSKQDARLPSRPKNSVRTRRTLAELLTFAKERMASPFAEEQKLRQSLGDDPVKIKKELVEALRKRDRAHLVACILLLARIGRLQDALKQSESWRQTVAGYAEKKYPEARVREFIDARPTDPIIISEFLQYLLQDRLNMAADEAAIVGMELGDIMGGEYKLMAYADEAEGTFLWAPHAVENGKLVNKV